MDKSIVAYFFWLTLYETNYVEAIASYSFGHFVFSLLLLYVVLVQILPYNCSETYYSFCENSPPQQDSALYQDVGFTLIPFSPHYFFAPLPLCNILSIGCLRCTECDTATQQKSVAEPSV